MGDTENKIPELPIEEILDMDMSKTAETEELIRKVRGFLHTIHSSLKRSFDEGSMIEVEERLKLLSNCLPSASMAKAIAVKAYHKRKLEITMSYLKDAEKKKIGAMMIKDIAKDACYAEQALLTLAEDSHGDIIEQIGALRSILSAHKAELGAHAGAHQK